MKVDEKNKEKEDLQIKKQQMRKKADLEKKKIMEQFNKLKNKKGNSLNRSGFQKLASDLGIVVEVLIQISRCSYFYTIGQKQ